MAIELNLSRASPDVSWGFRIVGGADFDEPLIVVKVNENSLAEKAGLQIGDLLVRINDTPTAGITHAGAHDLLVATGNSLLLAVRRGEMPTHIFHYEVSEGEETLVEKPEEKPDILKEIEASLEKTVLNEAVERINQLNIKNSAEEMKKISSLLNENLSGQEEIVYTSMGTKTTMASKKSISHGIKTDNKWSTFLMKPDKPIVKPKQKIEEEKAKGEGYKVVIKKQPSRRKRAEMEKKVHFDENVIETRDEDIKVEENEEYTKIEYKRNVEVDIDVNVTEEEIIEDVEGSIVSENDADDEVEVDSDSRRDSTEVHFPPLSEIKVNNETSLTLEDQLRQVQKQLEALAHLPSAIQRTLDAVSKQLAEIVSARESSQEKEPDSEPEREEEGHESNAEEEDVEEYRSVSDNAEAELDEHEVEDSNSNVGEDLEDDVAEDELKELMERNATPVEELEVDDRMNEEQLLEKMREEETLEKKKKAMGERQALSRGRRRPEPEEEVPIFKKPQKLSEEKIFEIIENNLEVISGKRKGINFKKFQPPAKNMEYLQHSEVLRMLNEVDRPQHKGIGSRAEKVPAVQDYYEAIKGQP